MGFTSKELDPILYWFTLVILCVFPMIGAVVLYKLAGPARLDLGSARPSQATVIGL